MTEALREDAESHALDVGRGAGEVLMAAESAVHSSRVGKFAEATWVVDADTAGKITHVQVRDASDDLVAWNEAAAHAFDHVVVSAPKGPHGVRITFHIEVADRLPGGQADDGSRGGFARVVIPLASLDFFDVGKRPSRIVRSHVVEMQPL